MRAFDAEDGTITARWMEPPGPYHGLRDMVEHAAQIFAVEIFAEDLITAGLLPTRKETETPKPEPKR